MKRKLFLVFIIYLTVNLGMAQDADTIIAWTFPDTAITTYSWEGLESNHGKYQVIAFNADETVERDIDLKNGATTLAAQASGWENGANDKCWYIKFKAENYENMNLSVKITSGGNKPGPAHFYMQYKIGSSGTWTDISNSDITVANDWTTGVLNNFNLPSELDNPSNAIHIRFIMKDNFDEDGNEVQSTGISKIDDIFITGKLNSSTGFFNPESSKNICYPNPSNGRIKFDVNKDIHSISVYNLIGTLMYKNNNITNNQVYLSNLKKGFYIIQAKDNDSKAFTEKIYIK